MVIATGVYCVVLVYLLGTTALLLALLAPETRAATPDASADRRLANWQGAHESSLKKVA